MLPLLIRTAFIYIFMIIAIRLTGKRQVGELQLSELITAFLISEVAAAPLSDPDMPLSYAVFPILALICLEIIISFLITKSLTFKHLFEAPPTALICRGQLSYKSLKRQRLTADELLSSLRLGGVPDIGELSYCFLEHNGQISAFTKNDKLTLPVVTDGRVNKHFLKLLGRDEAWLYGKMKKDGKATDSLFLALSDGNDITYILYGEGK